MERIEDLFLVDPNSWIDALPDYQKNTIRKIHSQNRNYEETAKEWLSAAMPTTVPFGTEKGKSVFYEKVLDEIEAFFSGDEKYKDDRIAILQEKSVVQTYVVGVISVALAPVLGASSVFLAPVIAIALVTITKVGINAWLATRKEQRNKEQVSNNSN